MPSQRAARMRALARILTGERAVTAATRRALDVLLREAARALAAAGYDTSVLDNRFPGWRAAVGKDVIPTIEHVFTTAWHATARGTIDPSAYATRHIEAVHNRLVNVADDVFDAMRLTLMEGRQAQESIPQLAARVDGLLTDSQRWTNRATTIARTEVISANNAGSQASAFASADLLGIEQAQVARSWLATGDSRTRETHAEADGQVVFGQQPYSVGGYDLSYPGDPYGPAEEVINCRCVEQFLLPGDPGYPASDTSTSYATSTPLTVVPDTAAPEPVLVPSPAAISTPVAAAHVDPGPQTTHERVARGLTIHELMSETKRSKVPEVRRAAKAELRRRGVAASLTAAYLTAEDLLDSDRPLDLVLVAPDGTTTALAEWVAAITEEDPAVSTTAPEAMPADTAAPSPGDGTTGPTHAGIAVQAADTHRVLLQQRTLDPEDPPEVQGTWEWPGGGLEDGEAPLDGAWREWVEETGLPQPTDATVTGSWTSPDGVYQGFLITVPTEDGLGLLNPDGEAAHTQNPDDPERDAPDITAWFTTDQVQGMGAAVRPEVLASTDWSLFAAPLPNPAEAEEAGEGETPEQEAAEPDEDPVQAAMALLHAAGYTLALDSIRAASEHAGMPDGPDGLPPQETPLVDPEDPVAPNDAEDMGDGQPFYGIIWPEDTMSGDSRAIAADATTWRDLPLPIMAQDAQAPGHDGAVRVGRLDTLERDSTTYSVPVIRYTGVWDTNPTAVETARQVDKGVVRGISTDGDRVTIELRGSDGSVLDPMVDDFPADGVVIEVATEARVSGGTVCSIPAFHQAYIANGTLADRTDPEPGWNPDGTPKDNVLNPPAAPADAPEAVAASAWSLVAAGGPALVQPADAFVRPACLDDNPEGTPLTVTEDGRVYGHLAVWGTCHIGVSGTCQEPPVSMTNYAYFATGSVPTDDGRYVATGPLTMGTGHAALRLGYRPAVDHYDNTGTAVADVVMGQDHIGIWFSGMTRPGITPEQVYALRAAGKVSGDWREQGGNLELCAALVVNTPGFSIPRPAVAASGYGATALVAAGMVRTPQPVETLTEAERIAALVVATLDRRERGRIAASRIHTRLAAARRDRAVAAAARLVRG